MNKTATTLAALSLSAVSAFAGTVHSSPAPMSSPITSDRCAGGISYNTVELLYANTDSDLGSNFNNLGGDGDADGVRLNFEYSPVSNFYVRLGTGYDEADYWDSWHISAGIGGYVALTDNIHLAADGGILWAEWDGDVYNLGNPSVNPPILPYWESISDDDTGWYVRPHVRAKWGCLEVHAGVAYTDMFHDEDWAFFAKAYFQVWNGWDIAVGYNEGEMNADAETWTIGARWKY